MEGTNISSDFLTFIKFKPTWSADVPLIQAIAYLLFTSFKKFFSNKEMYLPEVAIQLDLIQSLMYFFSFPNK